MTYDLTINLIDRVAYLSPCDTTDSTDTVLGHKNETCHLPGTYRVSDRHWLAPFDSERGERDHLSVELEFSPST